MIVSFHLSPSVSRSPRNLFWSEVASPTECRVQVGVASLEHCPSVHEREGRLLLGINEHHPSRIETDLASCKHRPWNLRQWEYENSEARHTLSVINLKSSINYSIPAKASFTHPFTLLIRILCSVMVTENRIVICVHRELLLMLQQTLCVSIHTLIVVKR